MKKCRRGNFEATKSIYYLQKLRHYMVFKAQKCHKWKLFQFIIPSDSLNYWWKRGFATSRFLRWVNSNAYLAWQNFQMVTYLCCLLVPSLKLWAAVILEKANSSHFYQWRELKLNKLQILFLTCGINRFVPIITRIVHEKCSQFWEFSEGCLGREGSGPMRLKIRKKENV